MNKEETVNKLLEIYSKLSLAEKSLNELKEIISTAVVVKDEILSDKIKELESKNHKLKSEVIGITIPKINLNN